MKFKKLILLIPLLSSILFFSSTPLLVRAYNSDTYSDLGGDYEGDWGAYAPKRTNSSELAGSVPSYDGDDVNNNAINTDNYYRFTHWAGLSEYGDCRGWQFVSREWAKTSMYKDKTSYWLPDYYNGSGKVDPPSNVFATDGVQDAVTYNDGIPWGYSSGSDLNYMRWGIIWYKREKPTPTMTDIGVSNFSKYYSTGDKSLWATPSANGQFWCQAEDRYPQTYGNAIQREGAVRRGLIWITGTNGLDYFGYTDMNKNTKDTTFCCDDTKDKEWINLKEKVAGKKDEEWIKLKEKIVGMSNEESVTHTYYNSLKTFITFKAEDGEDYQFKSAMNNKWLRETSVYSIFNYNGVQKDKLRIDGQAPIWNDVNVTTDTSSSNTTVTVSGLKDVRGKDKTDVGCGVNSKGINLVVVPVNKAGVSLDLPQFITTYSIKSGSIESSSTISFDVNYSSLGFSKYNKFKIKATFSDNLDNTNYTNEYIVNRQLPKPQNAELSIEQYKYKKDNTYWVNCKDNFIIKTQCSSHTDFTGYPTETILYMGSGSAYAEQYNGFSSIATTQGSNINTSSDKDKYIKKYLEYIATEDNITKTLKSYHNLKANTNASGLKYSLHTMGRTNYDSEWYLSTMYNSNDIIGIDGIAPTIDKAEGIDEYNKFTVKVSNIYDHDLSGSKEVDFIVKRNGDNIIKKTVLVSDKSTIRQVFTKDELKEYGEYTVEVWTRDNVDNEIKVSEIKVNMLNPINIAAKRVDIYDPREERYVSQVVSGLDYIAVVEYTNTGSDDIDNTRQYSVGLNIADVDSGTVKGEPLQAGETKEARFNFTAGEENLLGNVYEGAIDIDNELEESNENDNVSSTKEPYKEKVSDTNPPTIPTPNTQGKPSVEVPIITIKLDFIADYINVVELGTENDEVDELICEDPYRLKYKVSNNSSLNIKYIDIKNKSFETTVYYDDNIQLDTIVIDDIGAAENKTFYKDFTTPLLPDGVVEENKALKEVVDSSNKIYEMDEKNNSLLRRKKVLALKVTDYRITEMVNPIQKYTFPIMYTDMPANCKSGYNVTFRCNVKGNRDKLKVIAKLSDTNGTPYDTITMTRVEEVSTTEGIYEYVLTVPLDLPQGTIISSEVIATQDTATYNFNNKNLWNGKTLTIGGNAKEDIVIYRKY